MSKIHLSVQKEPLHIPPETRYHPGLDTWHDGQGREYGFGLPWGSEYLLRVHNVGTFMIRPGHSYVTGFRDEGVDLRSFRDAFFHGVAPWILQQQKWDCIHASAVLAGSAVVVFCGPPERGKSTMAHAWSDRGALAYADDAVPFLVRDGVAMAARIPQRLRLREPAASWFPHGRQHTPDGAFGDELVYDLEPTLRPLRLIYWLEPMSGSGEGSVVIEQLPALEAFSLLMSQARFMSLQDRDRNRKMVRNYLSLVHLTPVFRLSFPIGLHLLPAILDRLERHQRGLTPRLDFSEPTTGA